MPFARYLERQNREIPEVRHLKITRDRAPAPVEPVKPRPDVARIGDVLPVERTVEERRLRTVYRIELPLRTGRVLDVLV